MDFVSVRTATIRPSTELLFDVYVFFQESYVKYKSASQAFEGNVLDKFKAKSVKKLFIPKEQEALYLKYLDHALDDLQKKDMKTSERADLAQDTLKQEADNIDKTLESEEAYKNSESRINKVVDFMLAEPKAMAGMLESAGLSVDDSSHGSTLSSLCLGVGVASKFVGREELTDLTVAALLHDNGLKKFGFDIRSDLTTVPKDKRVAFRRHPELAVEQVSGKKFITARVLRLIQDHEEYGEGLGFPEKKWFKKLQVDSQIFNICDAFDHHSIRATKKGKECFADFKEKRLVHFDAELMDILEKQLNG